MLDQHDVLTIDPLHPKNERERAILMTLVAGLKKIADTRTSATEDTIPELEESLQGRVLEKNTTVSLTFVDPSKESEKTETINIQLTRTIANMRSNSTFFGVLSDTQQPGALAQIQLEGTILPDRNIIAEESYKIDVGEANIYFTDYRQLLKLKAESKDVQNLNERKILEIKEEKKASNTIRPAEIKQDQSAQTESKPIIKETSEKQKRLTQLRATRIMNNLGSLKTEVEKSKSNGELLSQIGALKSNIAIIRGKHFEDPINMRAQLRELLAANQEKLSGVKTSNKFSRFFRSRTPEQKFADLVNDGLKAIDRLEKRYNKAEAPKLKRT